MDRPPKNVISPASSLSVHRHNVSSAFTTAVFPDFQAAFLQEHVSILRNTIVYGDIKIYHCNVSQKVAFYFHNAFCSITWEPSNSSLSIFFTATQLHIDVKRDVPSFCSAGHICSLLKLQPLIAFSLCSGKSFAFDGPSYNYS